MKKLRILPAVLVALLLTTQVFAAPAAELVRVFTEDGRLYTYVSLTDITSPITKAEAKLGNRSFPASGPLETVRQAGFPVEYLLLVNNSNSMPLSGRKSPLLPPLYLKQAESTPPMPCPPSAIGSR